MPSEPRYKKGDALTLHENCRVCPHLLSEQGAEIANAVAAELQQEQE